MYLKIRGDTIYVVTQTADEDRHVCMVTQQFRVYKHELPKEANGNAHIVYNGYQTREAIKNALLEYPDSYVESDHPLLREVYKPNGV